MRGLGSRRLQSCWGTFQIFLAITPGETRAEGSLGDAVWSAEGLARMMTLVVELFAEFGQTPPPPPPPPLLPRQRDSDTPRRAFRPLGRLVDEDGGLTREINHRGRAAWECVRRYRPELVDRSGAPRRLKVRLFRAEAMEASLYGCVTRSPRKDHYGLSTTIHR